LVGWSEGLRNLLHGRLCRVLVINRSLACSLLVSNDLDMVIVRRAATKGSPKAGLLFPWCTFRYTRPALLRLHDVTWNRHKWSLDIVPRARSVDSAWWPGSRSVITRPAFPSLSARLFRGFIDLEDTKSLNQTIDAGALLEWVELRRWTAGCSRRQLLSLVLVLPAKVRSGANLFLVAVSHY
jgi:hypothetical protein